MMKRWNLLTLAAWAMVHLGCATAEGSHFKRAPYLQAVTKESALVILGLHAPCPVRVLMSEGGATPEREVPSSSEGTWHVVPLTGLSAGTAYTYAVEACGRRGPAARFLTAPERGQPLHFAAVGDSGTGDGDQRAVAESIRRSAPQLLLALGDNAYEDGTQAEYQRNFFTPMAALLESIPVFATLGNHEYRTQEGQPFLDNFYLPANNPRGTERYYSFDWGDVHFVSLDSTCALGRTPRQHCTPAEQQQWLVEDLAATQARWKVVFLHHPPWSSGKEGSSKKLQRALAPLFEAGGVDLVLSGHEHAYERIAPMKGRAPAAPGTEGAVTYVVIGTGGREMSRFKGAPPEWSVMRSAEAHGFLEVHVEGTTLTARMRTPSGRIVDSFSLTNPVEDIPGP